MNMLNAMYATVYAPGVGYLNVSLSNYQCCGIGCCYLHGQHLQFRKKQINVGKKRALFPFFDSKTINFGHEVILRTKLEQSEIKTGCN